MGGRKSYNFKRRCKKSDQTALTFLGETKEYAAGAFRSGDRSGGNGIAAHLHCAYTVLAATVNMV